MDNSITITITSCGRIKLLKETIFSLEKSCDISIYKKIIVEDSKNQKHLEKIKEEKENGFLRGWEIIFSNGVGDSNQEKHYNALQNIYKKIKTKYIFHCEDDWYFKKQNFNFIDISKKILEKYENIGIILLRNFGKDGGLNHISLDKNERYNNLFGKEIKILGIKFLYMRNDNKGDEYFGFSLNPGLRRKKEMESIMFGDKKWKTELEMGKKYQKSGLKSIIFKEGLCYHIGGYGKSTSLNQIGFFKKIKDIISGTYRYRIKVLLWERRLKKYFNKK